MSVATAASTEPPPSKLDSGDASEPTSAPDAGGADAFDRDDSANSSPNPQRDDEIQSPDVLKSEEYRQLFHLPPEEVLIEDFNCALQENILIQGHMYLFVHFICFYSNIFGFETKRIIPFNEVTSVRRAKTAGIFHNAIEIFAGGKKHFFASFLSRDEAFKIINDGWSQHGDRSRAVLGCQDTVSESVSSQGNGSIAIENSRNSKGLDGELLPSDMSKDTPASQAVGSLSNVEDGIVLMTASEQPSSETHVAEPVSNNDDSKVTLELKEDKDAPKISEDYTLVAESKFPIRVEDFFKYFFSDDSVNFLKSFHIACGDKDFQCSSWHPQEKFGYTREISYQHPIKLYLGAKFGGCHGVQKFRVYRNSHLVIQTMQEVSDVPYADYFCVEGLWDIERDPDESTECCILKVYVNVAFSKKTIWKGKIVQSTIEECREAYATWINMAHELLKQKHLEKPEVSVATTSGTQNGEVNSDVEVQTVEFSQRSQEPCNPSRAQEISDSINRHVVTHLPGNFIDTSSVPSLLKEFMTKLRMSLKSQSHLTLLLVIIFAMIFFMQFSILMLLARPQHIHVSPSADYMTKIENGMTRSSSQDIAWLEKRIHHLRDEMYMVEARLERMRYEHALLKKQLKDLERR